MNKYLPLLYDARLFVEFGYSLDFERCVLKFVRAIDVYIGYTSTSSKRYEIYIEKSLQVGNDRTVDVDCRVTSPLSRSQ